jgi:hypothetical protein
MLRIRIGIKAPTGRGEALLKSDNENAKKMFAQERSALKEHIAVIDLEDAQDDEAAPQQWRKVPTRLGRACQSWRADG